MLAQLKADFPEGVRVIYRHFPLINIHDKAALATQAAEAAGLQGEFWAMHDLLYGRQPEWLSANTADFQDWLIGRAEELGLDDEMFRTDLTADAAVRRAEEAWAFGSESGIPGTPFLLINNTPYGGPLDYLNLSTIVKLILLEERQFLECPELTIDPARDYIATIQMEQGDITLQLYADRAPIAVNSFIFLANQDWFNGVTFHRVIPEFMAQAGDPSGTGFGGPGYAFDNEVSPDLSFDRAGLVAMANAGPGSNGSQFFITYTPQTRLDGNFTIFGEVISGMEVVEKLTPRNPDQNANLPPDH